MSYKFCLFFNFFVLKTYFLSFRWGIIPMDFVGFLFRDCKLKNDISATLNTSFHIDLGRFVGD
jgi:hypothetical protein